MFTEIQAETALNGLPLDTGGAYVHIPFCVAKCGYCDFFSVPIAATDSAEVVQAIAADFRHLMASSPMLLRTVFIGGGTPTSLDCCQLATLLHAVGDTTRDHLVEEFTMEANPATIDAEKVDLMKSCGVSRVSLGAQSFCERDLAVLQRRHRPEDVVEAVALLKSIGLSDINLDLIFGICGQTLLDWEHSLQEAIRLRPTHVSCYGLTYELGTAIHADLVSGKIKPCGEAIEAEMYRLARRKLAEAGFEQYEISNFARPGHRCRQNLTYWHNSPYVGAGPSASGYVNGCRYKNISDIAEYVRRVKEGVDVREYNERIVGAAAAAETLMLQIRLTEGVDLSRFQRRHGIPLLDAGAAEIEKLIDQGLLIVTPDYLQLTPEGMLMADAVLTELACVLDRWEPNATAKTNSL